jgi:predicted nucleic acid-binding protein
LIDSWAWIEYFRGSKAGDRAREWIESSEKAVISTINVAEVYRWILLSYDEDIAEEKRRVMKRRCFVIPVTETIAVDAAKIRKEKGFGLGDAIILATAKEEKARILTGDEDFGEVDDVIIIR